jgi:hypothetical protein
MRSFTRAGLMALLLGAAVVSGIAVSTARADTFTLSMSSAPSGTVGTAVVITATGSDPTDAGALYLEIDAIPTSLTTTCPAGYTDAGELASATSQGALVSFDELENYDASGNFSNVNAWVPNAAGQFLLCGYTDDGALDTLAIASKLMNITTVPAPPPPPPPPPVPVPTPHGKKPVNTTKPRVTRAGNTLSCSAGRWSNTPQRYAYRWLVARKVKGGAHGRTLGSARQLRGHGVQCSVTAANAAGSATATSAPFTVH